MVISTESASPHEEGRPLFSTSISIYHKSFNKQSHCMMLKKKSMEELVFFLSHLCILVHSDTGRLILTWSENVTSRCPCRWPQCSTSTPSAFRLRWWLSSNISPSCRISLAGRGPQWRARLWVLFAVSVCWEKLTQYKRDSSRLPKYNFYGLQCKHWNNFHADLTHCIFYFYIFAVRVITVSCLLSKKQTKLSSTLFL